MRKFAALLMMLCLGLFIVGCNGGDEPAADSSAPADGAQDDSSGDSDDSTDDSDSDGSGADDEGDNSGV